MRASIVLCSILVSLLGCDRPSHDNAPKPTAPADTKAGAVDPQPDPVGDPSLPAADPGSQPAAAASDSEGPLTEVLKVDPAQSKVGFAVARATVGHVGQFEAFEATLRLEGDQPVALEIQVKTGSVVADQRGLTEHLKSADFFGVDDFPVAIFTAESITPAKAEGAGESVDPGAFEVVGTMSLHGITGKLTFPATVEVEPERVLGRATLDISAKAFGINYQGMEAELAEDAVQLEIELVFPRAPVP